MRASAVLRPHPGWGRWAAIGGIVGALALGASFGIVPKPPAVGAPTAVLDAYARAHHDVLLWSAWLEGIGTLLYVTFLLSLVHLSDANRRISGTLTLLAAAVVLGISLVYDVCLIAMAQGPALGGPQLRTGSVAYGLWAGCEHAFLIAPATLLPLGFALRGSAVASRGVPELGDLAWLHLRGAGTRRPVLRAPKQRRSRWHRDQGSRRRRGRLGARRRRLRAAGR
jgi:hypothetical protein